MKLMKMLSPRGNTSGRLRAFSLEENVVFGKLRSSCPRSLQRTRFSVHGIVCHRKSLSNIFLCLYVVGNVFESILKDPLPVKLTAIYWTRLLSPS